jgi:glycosyltransferase involved in cell wall biosynthesis
MVLIFESHPVQYKAPVYQRLQKLRPNAFRVVYYSDCSLRGYRDREFGATVAWDAPLLAGYENIILNNERGVPLQGFVSLTGRGIFRLLQREKPRAVLLSQFLYQADLVTYLSCLWLRIPIWIRHETQDEAFQRPAWKKLLRDALYRLAYQPLDHAFYIGQLNREHLLRHGVHPERMSFSPYCVVSPADGMTQEIKQGRRDRIREQLGIATGETLVLFSGKLIEKKNPGLILQALQRMPSNEARRFQIVFVGSGDLEGSLKSLATPFSSRVHFTGFVNQSKITDYYLAADILVLPSRKAGETWGLVVNEALQAGCSVIMTDAVGCHREFEEWERARVIPEGDVEMCARAMRDLASFPRAFDWCAKSMELYSVAAAAEAISRQIAKVEGAFAELQ